MSVDLSEAINALYEANSLAHAIMMMAKCDNESVEDASAFVAVATAQRKRGGEAIDALEQVERERSK